MIKTLPPWAQGKAVFPLGAITLLTKGLDIAKTIYERHTILSEFFEQLGVKKDIAVADACKIEHDISPESFKAIKKLVKNNRANAK